MRRRSIRRLGEAPLKLWLCRWLAVPSRLLDIRNGEGSYLRAKGPGSRDCDDIAAIAIFQDSVSHGMFLFRTMRRHSQQQDYEFQAPIESGTN